MYKIIECPSCFYKILTILFSKSDAGGLKKTWNRFFLKYQCININ